MQIVFAGATVVSGLLVLLAGVYGLRRTRQILAAGHSVTGLVKRPPAGAERALLQFETADGRVMEIVSPVPLDIGSVVELSYDPADPRDVALPAHRRTGLDVGFVVAGAAVVVLAAVLAATSF